MRTFELVMVVDPRVSDDDVIGLSGDYKQMLANGGALVTKTELWGRRKLAYPIEKVGEGKYVVLYFAQPGGGAISEVERRLQQNDKILRFLTVRTDEDLKRAGRPLPLEVEVETPTEVVATSAVEDAAPVAATVEEED